MKVIWINTSKWDNKETRKTIKENQRKEEKEDQQVRKIRITSNK